MKQQIDWRMVTEKISPYQIKKGVLYLQNYGVKSFWDKFTNRFGKQEIPYMEWLERMSPTEEMLEAQRKKNWDREIKISLIVPVYRTDLTQFRELVSSIRSQTYGNWELCLADGSEEDGPLQKEIERLCAEEKRIVYRKLEKNKGIVGNTNEALAMASGEYLGFLDHDDILSADALYEVRSLIQKEPALEMIYSDEDKMSEDGKMFHSPHFKPEFSPDLLRSNNYICHFLVVSRELQKRVGEFDPAFEGAQDHDFILRCTEQTGKIGHIPRILYHWREHPDSTADNPFSKRYAYEAGKRAIEASLLRQKISASVFETDSPGFYRVSYAVRGTPLVSIIIPNKDHTEDLKTCIDSVLKKTTWKNYEILVVDNQSSEASLKKYYREIKDQVRLFSWKKTFNYSAINNYAVRHARGEYLVFLNNDTEVINEDWLTAMLGNCQRPEVGITGARLLYPDHTVQHAGIIIGPGEFAGALFTGLEDWKSGYLHKAKLQQNFSAVTAAAMMIRRDVFEAVGGFDEALPVAFNDVDLCLRVRKENFLIVYDPQVLLFHAESKTRGMEDTQEKLERFQRDAEYMKARYPKLWEEGDPYYNRNLSRKHWDYRIADPDDLIR